MFTFKRSKKQTVKFVVIRPGATDFDQQGRIKGSLNIPMNSKGTDQATKAAIELKVESIAAIYSSPSECARQTANLISNERNIKIRTDENLGNLDCGLWHGKQLDEIRHNQPRLYRHWLDDPASVCPPQGESIEHARARAKAVINRVRRNHADEIVAIVVDEPMASILSAEIQAAPLTDLATHATNYRCGQWEILIAT